MVGAGRLDSRYDPNVRGSRLGEFRGAPQQPTDLGLEQWRPQPRQDHFQQEQDRPFAVHIQLAVQQQQL